MGGEFVPLKRLDTLWTGGSFGISSYVILDSGSQYGQVGEWLKPTDCKSVPPSEVRRFESFPVHQYSEVEMRSRSYESLGNGADCLLGFRSSGVRHAKRFPDPVADAVDSGNVRIQELGAT